MNISHVKTGALIVMNKKTFHLTNRKDCFTKYTHEIQQKLTANHLHVSMLGIYVMIWTAKHHA